MCVDGILDCYIEEGSVNGDIFFSTILKLLLPQCDAIYYNGTNPCSVKVLDNASIQHIDGSC